MSNVLRVGIVGCGDAARMWHIPSFLKKEGVDIAAVCDVNEQAAKQAAERIGTGNYYLDISDMLKGEKLDIVDICTSPRSHTPLCIEALEAGCHVLVEKPITLSTKEAEEIVRASRNNGVKLCVVHSKLFQPMTMKAKRMVDSGQIGRLTGIDIRDAWGRYNPDLANREHWYHRLPGGVFGEMLPHSIYLAMSFLGDIQVASVRTKKLTTHEWVAADELRVIVEGENGLGTITLSCNWPRGESTVDIYGTRRNLHVNLRSALLTRHGSGGDNGLWRGLDNLSQSYQHMVCTASAAFNTILGRYSIGHHTLISRFIDSVRDNTEPPVTGEEGREVVRQMEIIVAGMSGAT
jgi:predicted dehydrogenase